MRPGKSTRKCIFCLHTEGVGREKSPKNKSTPPSRLPQEGGAGIRLGGLPQEPDHADKIGDFRHADKAEENQRLTVRLADREGGDKAKRHHQHDQRIESIT